MHQLPKFDESSSLLLLMLMNIYHRLISHSKVSLKKSFLVDVLCYCNLCLLYCRSNIFFTNYNQVNTR